MMDYFYGNQIKQFTSIEIPKELLTGNRFSMLSPSSKMLYAIMLDRMKLASRNKWIDEERRIFILYPLSMIQKDIRFSRHTIIACLAELEDIGLISRIQIKGKASRIYVKNFNEQRVLRSVG